MSFEKGRTKLQLLYRASNTQQPGHCIQSVKILGTQLSSGINAGEHKHAKKSSINDRDFTTVISSNVQRGDSVWTGRWWRKCNCCICCWKLNTGTWLFTGSNVDARDWFWPLAAIFINKISISLLLHITLLCTTCSGWTPTENKLISLFLQLPSSQVHAPQRQHTIQFLTPVIAGLLFPLNSFSCDMQQTDKWNLFASPNTTFLIEGHFSFVFHLQEDYVSRNLWATPFKCGW